MESIRFKRALLAFAVVACALFAACVLAQPALAKGWVRSGWDESCELTNGKTTFYVESSARDASTYKYTFTIYKRSAFGTVTKQFKVRDTDITLDGYCRGRLFYSVGASGSNSGSLYCCKLSTGKKRCLIKNDMYAPTQANKYLIGNANSGAWGPSSLYSINMRTCKVKKITSRSGSSLISGSKLYFVQCSSKYVAGKGYTCKVVRCKLNGSGKKTVSKSFKGNSTSLVSKHKVSYSTGSYAHKTLRF